MSDSPHGPGWWYASDGKWYPPELAADRTVGRRPEPEPEPMADAGAEESGADLGGFGRGAATPRALGDELPAPAPDRAGPGSTEAPHDPFAASDADEAFDRFGAGADPASSRVSPSAESLADALDEELHDPFAPSPEVDEAFARLAEADTAGGGGGGGGSGPSGSLTIPETPGPARLRAAMPASDAVVLSRRAAALAVIGAVVVLALLGVLWFSARSEVSDLEADLERSELLRTELAERAADANEAEERAEVAEVALAEAEERIAELEAALVEPDEPDQPDEPDEPDAPPEAPPAPTLPPTAVSTIAVPGGVDDVSVRPGAASTISATGGYAVIDVGTNEAIATLGASASAARIVDAAEAGIWLTDPAEGAVVRLTPGALVEATRIAFADPAGIVVIDGSPWVASTSGGFVARIDPATLLIAEQIALPAPPVDLAVVDGTLWVSTPTSGAVHRVDRASGEVTTVILGGAPGALAPGLGRLWVVDRDVGLLHSVDPVAGAPARGPSQLGGALTDVVVLDGDVWVVSAGPDELVQVDAATGEIVTRTPLGGPLGGLAIGHESVWVAVPGDSVLARITVG